MALDRVLKFPGMSQIVFKFEISFQHYCNRGPSSYATPLGNKEGYTHVTWHPAEGFVIY